MTDAARGVVRLRRLIWPILRAIPAAAAWFIALFILFNLAGETLRAGFDADYLWMPLEPADWWGTELTLGLFAALLIASLVRPTFSGGRYALTMALLLLLVWSALVEVWAWYGDLARDRLRTLWPFPFVGLTLIALLAQVARIHRVRRCQLMGSPPPAHPARPAQCVAFVCVLCVFLIGQLILAGAAWKPGKADCIVVLGAGVRPDGAPSRSLVERTLEGCRLYNDGAAPVLILSGGPATAAAAEPDVMLDIVRAAGIPQSRCVLDPLGRTTWQSALSVRRIMSERAWKSAILVSHEYHLSRAALAFHRAGVSVSTVPARRDTSIFKDARHILREMAAWLWYFPRPLWQPF